MNQTIDTFVAELERCQPVHDERKIPEYIGAKRVFGAFCTAYATLFDLRSTEKKLKASFTIAQWPSREINLLAEMELVGITQNGDNYEIQPTSRGIDLISRIGISAEEMIAGADAYLEQ